MASTLRKNGEGRSGLGMGPSAAADRTLGNKRGDNFNSTYSNGVLKLPAYNWWLGSAAYRRHQSQATVGAGYNHGNASDSIAASLEGAVSRSNPPARGAVAVGAALSALPSRFCSLNFPVTLDPNPVPRCTFR
jgi:hypothetical protein